MDDELSRAKLHRLLEIEGYDDIVDLAAPISTTSSSIRNSRSATIRPGSRWDTTKRF